MTTATATEQIEGLRAEIVEALSRGESVTGLETQLAEARAAELRIRSIACARMS